MKKYLMMAGAAMALAGMLSACGSDDDDKDKKHESGQVEETTPTEEEAMHNGHEYVDLGLRVKWATCNIGAEKPEEYGDYFAWGETVPYGKEDKSNDNNYAYTGSYVRTYYWEETYKFGDSHLTDYNTDEKYGEKPDYRVTLDPDDDAAHVNWGGEWRMPTKDEIRELFDNTTRDYAERRVRKKTHRREW